MSTPRGAESSEKRYWAFISYSHADSKEAEWLHKSLEGFKVPPSLVGTE
jgi:eukaryotic-like serine/threonine-protein kinase